RARRAPDGALVDADQAPDLLHAAGDVPAERLDAVLERGALVALVGDRLAQRARHQLDQHLAHERRLARAGNAGDAREDAEREIDIDAGEVVARDALE